MLCTSNRRAFPVRPPWSGRTVTTVSARHVALEPQLFNAWIAIGNNSAIYHLQNRISKTHFRTNQPPPGCVVFILDHSFYSSVHPASVLILHTRDIQIMWSETEGKTKTTAITPGTQACEMLAVYLREHNKTSQTREIRKIRSRQKSRQEFWRMWCKVRKAARTYIRAEEEQKTATSTRAKQHEDEEEDTGMRPKKT